MTILVEIEKRWHTPGGVPDGTVVYHASEGGPCPRNSPFSGCPLGRGRTEAEALRDLVRPGYALPYDTRVTVADLEVVKRTDYTDVSR